MLDDFIVRATLAAVGVAAAAGLLGCFVVWRRMAYFGDATAHATLLGVALALAFSISVPIGILLVAVMMAVLVHLMTDNGEAADTALGVLSHGALAIGLVAIAILPGVRVDLDAYLFGDVLTVSRWDLLVIWAGAAVVILILLRQWSALLTSTLNRDLAYAAGLNPSRQSLVLTVLLAVVVAVAIKVVGALLITAMLILPAAAAQGLTNTPERMAMLSVGLGITAAIGGVQLSVSLDSPTGPTIVCVATLLFCVTFIAGRLKQNGK